MAYVRGTTGTDVVVLNDATQYYADSGNDLVVGSQFSDSINGADGIDLLFGRDGKDYITGGKGMDIVSGGAGNDDFIFNAGDLVHNTGLFNGYLGLVDTVLDFHGAGGYKAYLGVEDDILTFKGFGLGTHIDFVKNVGDASNQMYHIVDPLNDKNSGYLLIHMSDGVTHLTTGDYRFI